MTRLPTLVQAAKGICDFEGYEDGVLYYRLTWYSGGGVGEIPQATSSSLRFPVPCDDSGSGRFEPTMKGINMLRWIRKEIARQMEQDELILKARAEWDPGSAPA